MINEPEKRIPYSFANINFLGKCNMNCFFCLGKDLEKEFSMYNYMEEHFINFKNFLEYISLVEKRNIKKIYITGQNTDPLLYLYINDLVVYLQERGFDVGIRTNGINALSKMYVLNKCRAEIGYTIHTFDQKKHKLITGTKHIPGWDEILTKTNNYRVSIVVNRYNWEEFFELIRYLSHFPKVQYIQARKISTETRYSYLKKDIDIYEFLYRKTVSSNIYEKIGEYETADIFKIYGKPVVFWRTKETTANSLNYFSNGVISDEYKIIQGYMNNCRKYLEVSQ